MDEELNKSKEEQSSNPKFHLRDKLKPLHAVIVILVIVLLFSVFEVARARQELKNFKTNPEQATSAEVEKLVSTVNKLVDLPKDENPTVATVRDPQKLKDQPFFEKAKEGDKVLIFSNNKLAVLYRPDTNKILDVAPINIGQSPNPGTKEAPQQEIKFIILNGTVVAGLAGRYQKEINNKLPSAKIISIGNAKSTDIEKTFLVDSAKTKSSQLAELAKTLGITTGTLPADQLDRDSDFIIVVGRDKQNLP